VRVEPSLLIVSSNPLALGLLKSPGEQCADIVVGDAQPLGIPAGYGGPHCGFFATTKKWMRRIPGRIVGETVDEDGIRGYVLTLQAREQHIRRDKATSNICSNQALNALAASVYLTALGKQGLREVAKLNVQKAHYAKQRLLQVPGVSSPDDAPFFNEFAVKLSRPVAEVNAALLEKGMIGGYDLGRFKLPMYEGQMLLAVTELRTKTEIDRLATELEAVL
jgi:glycine dehydrogenase subunit 1